MVHTGGQDASPVRHIYNLVHCRKPTRPKYLSRITLLVSHEKKSCSDMSLEVYCTYFLVDGKNIKGVSEWKKRKPMKEGGRGRGRE